MPFDATDKAEARTYSSRSVSATARLDIFPCTRISIHTIKDDSCKIIVGVYITPYQ